MTSSRSIIFFLACLAVAAQAFVLPSRPAHRVLSSLSPSSPLCERNTLRIQHSALNFAYTSPENEPSATDAKKKSLYPKVGDFVRYYDLDGGKANGQELVGKISYITKKMGSNDWIAEISELDDIGDGYFAEYPSRTRMSKRTDRSLAKVAPVSASFVRSEAAFKVPTSKSGSILVRNEAYELDGYLGPFGGEITVDQDILTADGIKYSELKNKLIKYAAITGVAGSLITSLVKGPEDAIIYGAGALASVLYLFLLTVKTDTMASTDSKLGANVSNLRFLMPIFVIVGVALYNKSLGDANPVQSDSPFIFSSITPEQFGSAILGFLTYRAPLFFSQIQDAFKDDGGNVVVPGSVGIAMQLAKDTEEAQGIAALETLTPILLVSGPQATGRAELIQQLVADSEGKFVTPKTVDKFQDGVTFERLVQRDEFLQVDPTGRYGITKDGIMTAGKMGESVVVVDADVELAKRLAKVSGARLIGVWVGLNTMVEFETRLEKEIASGAIVIPEDESKDSVIRARVKEIIKEVEYGISAGFFEFTILNVDKEKSIAELKEAASYCFK
jgi:guanylate kinase